MLQTWRVTTQERHKTRWHRTTYDSGKLELWSEVMGFHANPTDGAATPLDFLATEPRILLLVEQEYAQIESQEINSERGEYHIFKSDITK